MAVRPVYLPWIEDYPIGLVPEVEISQGQSWRDNAYLSMASIVANPQADRTLTLHTTTRGIPNPTPGPIPTSTGINIPGTINGVCGYGLDDLVSIGRGAVITRQLLRIRNAILPLTPIIEFCAGYPGSTWKSGGGGGLGPNQANFTASISAGVMTVSAMDVGSTPIIDGQRVYDNLGAIASGTAVASFGTGTGGVGTYNLNISQTVGSRAMFSRGISWDNQAALISAVQAVLPAGKMLDPVFKSVSYTQGGAADTSPGNKLADLAEMLTLYDQMNLPGSAALRFFLDLPAATSDRTTFPSSEWETYAFCRTHGPGMGGTWSGRCFLTTSSYPWRFTGADNIHTGDYGTFRWGETEGYVKHLVHDRGVLWTPLWRPLVGGAITRSGKTFRVPLSRPAGPDFADKPLKWQNDANDGIKEWPQKGWRVYRGGVNQPLVGDPVIDGLDILLNIGSTAASGDEISYGMYGPGGVNPSQEPGVGGNLMMEGPPSELFPGKYILAWMIPFAENAP